MNLIDFAKSGPTDEPGEDFIAKVREFVPIDALMALDASETQKAFDLT